MSSITKSEKDALLKLARETILAHLNGEPVAPLKAPFSDPKFSADRGVFVTLHSEGQLRGCIGYPLPIKPMLDAVIDNAISASTQDPRFPPVTLAEMDSIDIEISLLTVPKEASPDEVKVGRDGIIISKGFNKGLLLPQVPVEQNWDLDAYLSYGCMKAGLAQDEWRKGAKVETFEALVFGEKER